MNANLRYSHWLDVLPLRTFAAIAQAVSARAWDLAIDCVVAYFTTAEMSAHRVVLVPLARIAAARLDDSLQAEAAILELTGPTSSEMSGVVRRIAHPWCRYVRLLRKLELATERGAFAHLIKITGTPATGSPRPLSSISTILSKPRELAATPFVDVTGARSVLVLSSSNEASSALCSALLADGARPQRVSRGSPVTYSMKGAT